MVADLPYECEIVWNTPLNGLGLLLLASFFMWTQGLFATNMVDLGLKQILWSRFLDRAVLRRVKQMKNHFPNLGHPDPEDDEVRRVFERRNPGIPYYNRCASQSPYITGETIDEDLVTSMANDDAYGTISQYCASTVRGYAILSRLLLGCGITLSFLWLRNAMIYPENAHGANLLVLMGYAFVLMTGVVMTTTGNTGVYRQANIAMWSSIPYTTKIGKKLLSLHELGINTFVFLPLFVHIYMLYRDGEKNPNFATAIGFVLFHSFGLATFMLPAIFSAKGFLQPVQALKLTCVGEAIGVLGSYSAYMQWELYPTAACMGHTTGLARLVLASLILPILLNVKRHFAEGPRRFNTAPSIILMDGDKPVAVTGPCEAMRFMQNPKVLPHLDFPPSQSPKSESKARSSSSSKRKRSATPRRR